MDTDASSDRPSDHAADRTISDRRSENDAEYTDSLPADLDLDELDHAEYVFPNNNRRRIPAVMYLVIAAAGVACWALWSDSSALINNGLLYGSIGLAAFGLYSLIAGWNLDHDERDALVKATSAVGFPVGHASAQMGWRGWLSRPTWRILLYSNEPQPANRGLVLVDGADGDVLDWFVEDNPEDWSAFGQTSRADEQQS